MTDLRFFGIKLRRVQELLGEDIFTVVRLGHHDKPVHGKREKTKDVILLDSFSIKHEDKFYEYRNASVFDLIDFAEILRSFAGNVLDPDGEYSLFGSKLKVRMATKNGIHRLKLSTALTGGEQINHYLEKYECRALATKLNKFIQKIDLVVGELA